MKIYFTILLFILTINSFGQNKKTVPLAIVDVPPMYMEFDEEEKRILMGWFNKKTRKYMNTHFNHEVANNLGLSGIQKIYIRFTITSDNSIKIIGVRAPHKVLEDEARRVILSLPKIIHGKYKGKSVDITYTFPFIFKI